MNDDLYEDDDGFPNEFANAPTRHLHELYFPPLNVGDEEKSAAIAENERELRERVNKIINPIDAIHYQLNALNVMFHNSTFLACSHQDKVQLRNCLYCPETLS